MIGSDRMYSTDVIEYLKDSIGPVEEVEMDRNISLPLYMIKEYQLKEIKLLDVRFVLVEFIAEVEHSIEKLINRRNSLFSKLYSECTIVFVFRGISDYLRKRLIEEKIAFIIPGKQIFILELGMVYTERVISKYSNETSTSLKKLSPSSQGLLLYLLTSNLENEAMKNIAEKLDISLMSISRGYKELSKLNLVYYDDFLKSYRLSGSKEIIWNKAKPFMTNPVQKKINIEKDSITDQVWSKLVISGESALAEHSMLVGPRQRVMGMGSKEFKAIEMQLKVVPFKDINTIELQVFSYKLYSENGILNELSTALTLIDEKDERVSKEISIMLSDYFERIK